MGSVPQEVKREQLHHDSQHGRGRHRHQQGEQKTGIEQPDDLEAHVGSHHVDFAVGESHHAQGAEDQGEAQGQQRIDAALGKAVDELLKYK